MNKFSCLERYLQRPRISIDAERVVSSAPISSCPRCILVACVCWSFVRSMKALGRKFETDGMTKGRCPCAVLRGSWHSSACSDSTAACSEDAPLLASSRIECLLLRTSLAMACLMLFVPWLTQRTSDFDPRLAHVGFMMYKVVLERVFLTRFMFSPFCIIAPMLHTPITLSRRTNGRSLVTFKEGNSTSDVRETLARKVLWHCFLGCRA